jgi:FKBP-type peptidyl-prolyl cis-trans isomerase FklB
MKSAQKIIPVLAIIIFLSSLQLYGQDKNAKLKTFTDSVSYMIGYTIGNDFVKNGIVVNTEWIAKAISDAMNARPSIIDDIKTRQIQIALQEELNKKNQMKNFGQLETNKKDGEKFLNDNKSKPGVITLPSGLQYKIISAGTGPRPKATDTVTVHYTGKLLNGTTFDSSIPSGKPATFPLNMVIPGWTEGLQYMNAGGTYELYIPSNLGYGDTGAGEVIPPGAALIFEIQVIAVNGVK